MHGCLVCPFGSSVDVDALLLALRVSKCNVCVLSPPPDFTVVHHFSLLRPTLQLYVQGELVGGLDIVKEMKLDGPLAPQLGVTPKVLHISVVSVQGVGTSASLLPMRICTAPS